MTEQKPEQALTTDFLINYKSRLENLFKIEAGDNLTNKEYFSKFYTEKKMILVVNFNSFINYQEKKQNMI